MRPLHVPGLIRRRPQTSRLIIRPCLGPSGGRIQYAPTRVPGKNSQPQQGPNAICPYPRYNYSTYMYQANFAAPVGAVRRRLTFAAYSDIQRI